MSMTEIPTIENVNIPQTNSFEGPKVEASQPSVETENFGSTQAKIEDNTSAIGRDDLPKADIKIVGTNIPVSVGFVTFEDPNDDRISILKDKLVDARITD